MFVGIGAGFNRPEYEAAGIALDPVGRRVSRLAESIAILKGLFGDREFSFSGEHYKIESMDGLPKPIQRPHPPFLVGGGGRRLLELAVREADTIALAARFLPNGSADPRSITTEATREKLNWIAEAGEGRQREFDLCVHPQMSVLTVTDHAHREIAELAERIGRVAGSHITADELRASPHIYVGSVDTIVEKIRANREAFGINAIMLGRVNDAGPIVRALRGS